MLYGLIIFLIIFAIGFILFADKKENPYIKTHLRKWKNEKAYQEYLKWLDNQGGDLPLKEVKFKDDIEIINEITKTINK